MGNRPEGLIRKVEEEEEEEEEEEAIILQNVCGHFMRVFRFIRPCTMN
jgi:hypothetical protein